MRMSMDAMFTLELLLVAVVIIIFVAGAVYIATHNRWPSREAGRKVGTADVPVAPRRRRRSARPTRVLQEHGLGCVGSGVQKIS